MNLADILAEGIAELGLAVPPAAQQRMLDYLALVAKWNRAYNLTAVREPGKMLTHHLLDSLAVMPHLHGPRVLDVGSGAGLPGLPLALARPELQFTLLDASDKKTSFLRQAVIELQPGNVEVVCARVETWLTPAPFDTVVSRAFAEIADFVDVAGPLCASGGVMIAMKGLHPAAELERLPHPFRLQAVVALAVPGLDAQRHIALLQPAHQTA
jgi:16S rRNA (guanine527-N7)-methyltransferase